MSNYKNIFNITTLIRSFIFTILLFGTFFNTAKYYEEITLKSFLLNSPFTSLKLFISFFLLSFLVNFVINIFTKESINCIK